MASARRRLDELGDDPAETVIQAQEQDNHEDHDVRADAVDGILEDEADTGPADTVQANTGPAYDGQADDGQADTGTTGARPAGRGSRIFRAVMAAILVLAVGFGVGVWVGSPKYPTDDSADAGFARDMMLHHAQAVQMASLEFRTTGNDALKTLAVDITLTQQAQIGIMTAWLDTWGLSPTSTRAPMAWMPDGGKALIVDGRMPGMASDAQLASLQSSTGKARDILFCQLMIKHHLGGIHMADAVLPLTHSPQVKKLAGQIKASQQSEIDALQGLEDGLTGTK